MTVGDSERAARRITLIAAVARNGVIGADGAMPWHLPEDFAFFKRTTMGHAMVMGRKTWDSLGRPLPGRLNLVVSRQTDLVAEGAEVRTSLTAAVERAEAWAREREASEIMLIGGAQLFAEALPVAQRLYLTRVALAPAGDVFFPDWQEAEWELVSRQEHAAEDDRPAYACEVWERRA